MKKGGAVSRFLFLNPSFIYATYPLASDGQPSSASIFGFAGLGAVPADCRQTRVVSSCLTFSPLPPEDGGCFLSRLPEITPAWAFPSKVP